MNLESHENSILVDFFVGILVGRNVGLFVGISSEHAVANFIINAIRRPRCTIKHFIITIILIFCSQKCWENWEGSDEKSAIENALRF